MPIIARFKSRWSFPGVGKVRLVVCCDFCGKSISKKTPANVEFEMKSGSRAFFVHKKCSKSFRIGRPKMIWTEFSDHREFTKF